MQAPLTAGPGQRRAAWRLQVAGQRTAWAATSLAALAAASRTEDQYGVAQLSGQPSLGHVIAGLADLTALLGHFLKMPPGISASSKLDHLAALAGERGILSQSGPRRP